MNGHAGKMWAKKRNIHTSVFIDIWKGEDTFHTCDVLKQKYRPRKRMSEKVDWKYSLQQKLFSSLLTKGYFFHSSMTILKV